jgi:hypothetical protein
MQRHLARVRSITLPLSVALIVALVSSSRTAHADPKQGGATASALAQDSKPKPKPAPRSAAKTKKPAAPKAAAVPKAQPVPRAIGPKAEPAPKAVEPAKEKEKDKDGNDLPDRPKDGKVDGRKWRPRARA